METLVRRLCARAREQDGFTLLESLAVIAILGVVLAGLTQLFTSGANSELDQNNRVQAQQQARVGLDRLRREAHCASSVTVNSSSSITLSLPGWCIRTTLSAAATLPTDTTLNVVSTTGFASAPVTVAFGNGTDQTEETCTGVTSTSFTGCSGGASGTYTAGAVVTADPLTSTSVTWCAAGTSAPYTLERIVASSCTGTGTVWASYLYSSSIFSEPVFTATPLSPDPCVTPPSGTTGTLGAGTYSYIVTPVLTTNVEVPGSAVTATCSAGDGTNKGVEITWTAYSGSGTVAHYNVYGRGDAYGVTLLGTATASATSYIDYGPVTTTTTGNPLTLPSSTIGVQSLAGFTSGGANLISFGPSGPVSCTGTQASPAAFTGCSGGQDGNYPIGTTLVYLSTVRPPNLTLGISLVIDKTPNTGGQRFTLSDNVALRNSRPAA